VKKRAFSKGHGRGSFVLWPIVIVSTLVTLAVSAPLLSGESSSHALPRSTALSHAHVSAVTDIPRPVKPAFVPDKPRFLPSSQGVTRWAVVRAASAARVRANAHARIVGQLETETPEGTSNIVLVLGNHIDEAGSLWIRVRLPVLGEPPTGWVPREALGGYGTVTTRLVVDLDSLQAKLFRAGRMIFRADVGVGEPSWPTPRGEFYIRNKLTGFASPMYGPVAFGTSARSRVLTDWPAGGFVGIHGTDQPELLPGRVSHGCIRVSNADILRLSELMPVGTPLTIR
jgi:hypothetical protein